MKYNGYRPHFYLIFCIYVIQGDHSAYNYLKMPQKNYSNILNKHMTAVSYNSENKTCQHFKFGLSNMSWYITSLSHLLGNLSPDYRGKKVLPVTQDPLHSRLSLCPGGHLILLKANICSKLTVLVASRKLYSFDYFLS